MRRMLHLGRAASAIHGRRAAPRTWMTILLGVVIAGLDPGCTKRADNRFIPVSGRITMDGRPLSQASITFRSDRDQFPGLTDATGCYELKPGAIPGEYRVDVSKFEGNPQAMLAMDPGAVGRVAATPDTATPPRQMIPARYSDPKQTELHFAVTSSGVNRADFELMSRQ